MRYLNQSVVFRNELLQYGKNFRRSRKIENELCRGKWMVMQLLVYLTAFPSHRWWGMEEKGKCFDSELHELSGSSLIFNFCRDLTEINSKHHVGVFISKVNCVTQAVAIELNRRETLWILSLLPNNYVCYFIVVNYHTVYVLNCS